MKVLLLFLFLVGCEDTCAVSKRYTKAAATNIAQFFDCKSPYAVELSIKDTVKSLELCTREVESGLLAGIVCKPVAKQVSEGIIKNGLPKEWLCGGGVGQVALETAIYTACSQIPI